MWRDAKLESFSNRAQDSLEIIIIQACRNIAHGNYAYELLLGLRSKGDGHRYIRIDRYTARVCRPARHRYIWPLVLDSQSGSHQIVNQIVRCALHLPPSLSQPQLQPGRPTRVSCHLFAEQRKDSWILEEAESEAGKSLNQDMCPGTNVGMEYSKESGI